MVEVFLKKYEEAGKSVTENFSQLTKDFRTKLNLKCVHRSFVKYRYLTPLQTFVTFNDYYKFYSTITWGT